MVDNDTANNNVSFLFITANVGTLFEDLGNLQEIWIKEFSLTLRKCSPQFIALHFQEVGGKDYKSSMHHVDSFIQKLLNLEELTKFDIVRGYLDEDTAYVDQYTALGNFYFVEKTLSGKTTIWSYTDEEFVPITGRKIVKEKLKECPHVCKEKFEQGFFPDCKWSRKGYTRSRWKIMNKVIEFINIHLFHDDSNLVAIQSSPSPYSANRKRALKFVLQRIREDSLPNQDFFIFGDFNFRLDIKSFIQHHFDSQCPQITHSPEGAKIRLVYRDKLNPSKESLKVEKKLFKYDKDLLVDGQNKDFEHLKKFNEEVKNFSSELKEFDFSFPPTYPYSEDSDEATRYMNTRCPAWCDRVLLSPETFKWLSSQADNITYDTIGQSVCMGDHKPIYLAFSVKLDDVTSDDVTRKTGDTTKVNGDSRDTGSEPQKKEKKEDS